MAKKFLLTTAIFVALITHAQARHIDANCDGSDETAAIQADINNGGLIEIPNGGQCGVSRTITISSPVTLVGEGPNSNLLVLPTFSGTEVLLISPTAKKYDGYKFRDFHIETQNPSQSGPIPFMFSTEATGQYLRQAEIRGMIIDQINSVAIASQNYNTDGLASFNVRNNFINGGIFLNNAGDSIVIEENVITGPGISIRATFVPGANSMVIAKNNLTNTGGCLYIANTSNIRVMDNECELAQPYTGSVGALMYFEEISVGTVSQNQIQTLDNADAIYLKATNDFHVGPDNSIYTGATKYHYHLVDNKNVNLSTTNRYFTNNREGVAKTH